MGEDTTYYSTGCDSQYIGEDTTNYSTECNS